MNKWDCLTLTTEIKYEASSIDFLGDKIWLCNCTRMFQHMVYNDKIEKCLFHMIT